jgi:methyltransferase OMS1
MPWARFTSPLPSLLLRCSVTKTESSTPHTEERFPTEQERQNTFSTIAFQYDGIVRWSELTGGINRWRKLLVRHAYGDVLEIGVGTGRNFSFYRSDKVRSVTGIDFSRKMLEVALKKKGALGKGIELKLICADARKLEARFPGGGGKSFDCIVDTFGICSFEDPHAVLLQAREALKDDGYLLLLEHGESDYQWINKYLRKHLKSHVEKFGCYHERDIRRIVEDAGFKIVEERKKHFGSLRLFVCTKTS